MQAKVTLWRTSSSSKYVAVVGCSTFIAHVFHFLRGLSWWCAEAFCSHSAFVCVRAGDGRPTNALLPPFIPPTKTSILAPLGQPGLPVVLARMFCTTLYDVAKLNFRTGCLCLVTISEKGEAVLSCVQIRQLVFFVFQVLFHYFSSYFYDDYRLLTWSRRQSELESLGT